MLVEGFKELRARIIHLEQQQQQLLQDQPWRRLADEETVEDEATPDDSTVERQASREGGIDVFEHELTMLAGEVKSGCQQDQRIRRLEKEILGVRRKLERLTALPRD